MAATAIERPQKARQRKHGHVSGPGSAVGNALAYGVGVIIIVITVVPLLYVFLGGFRTTAQINEHPSGLPSPWVWTNYSDILTASSFWHFLLNSALIAVVATVLTVGLGA